jgi:hypothetical protein
MPGIGLAFDLALHRASADARFQWIEAGLKKGERRYQT